MNNADIVGIVCIVFGLLLVVLALYASPVFLIVSGAVVAIGIVLIITGGVMCRAKEDQEPDTPPVYAEAVPKIVGVDAEEEDTTGCTRTPPLTRVRL